MSRSTSTTVSRRSVLKGAAVAVAGAGAAGVAARPAAAQGPAPAPTPGALPPVRVKHRIQLVDGQFEQRFLLQDSKPGVYVTGRYFPPEARSGPPEGSYILFNDEDRSEKGGIIASRTGAQISFDYVQAQGMTVGTQIAGELGAAFALMHEMPDPDIPIEELTSADVPRRISLACTNDGQGAFLILHDHEARPRILLRVDDAGPRIEIWDEDGNVVAQLPEAPAAAARGDAGRPDALLDGINPRKLG